MHLKGIFKDITIIIKRPKNLIFLLGILFTSVSLIYTYYATTYTSDDVVWQNALLSWVPFSDDVFYGDIDVGFILQIPIYWLISLVIEPGRVAMFGSGLALGLINFTLFYWSSLYMLRILGIKFTYISLLPLLWVSTFGYALSWLFIGTNLHNVTVGLIFLLIVVVSKICRDDLRITRNAQSLVCVALFSLSVGLAIVNDRYFVYFGILPAIFLILVYFYKKLISIKKSVITIGIIVLGYLSSVLIVRVLESAGLILLPGVGAPAIVSFDNLIPYFMNTIRGYMHIMGADLFGLRIFDLDTVLAITNFIIACLVVSLGVRIIRKGDTLAPELLILAGTFFLVLVTHAFSTFNFGVIQTYRYMVLLPFIATLFLAYFIKYNENTRQTTIVKSIVIIAVIINIAFSLFGILSVKYTITPSTSLFSFTHNEQRSNYELIELLNKNSLSKGYAEYWSAHINTYLSKNMVKILPIECSIDGSTYPDLWFINEKRFTDFSNSSFIIFNNDKTGSPTCTPEEVVKQFGSPNKVLEFKSEKTIFIYNYDLINNMETNGLKTIK